MDVSKRSTTLAGQSLENGNYNPLISLLEKEVQSFNTKYLDNLEFSYTVLNSVEELDNNENLLLKQMCNASLTSKNGFTCYALECFLNVPFP